MSTVVVDAVEMKEATVTHISLVKRGANRIPFRIVKESQENDMFNIDLGKVMKGAAAKKEDVTNKVLGLVVAKDDATDNVKAALKSAGFSVDTMIEREDGTCVFKQGDDEIDSSTSKVVKVSDNLLVVMKGYDPYGANLDFMGTINSQAFYPSLWSAFDALYDVASKSMRDVGTPEEAVAALTPVLDDFKAYVISVAKNIPAEVFKAEKEVSDVIKAAKAEASAAPAEASAVTTETEVAGVVKDESEGGEAVTNADAPVPEGTTPPDIAEAIKAALGAALEPLTAMVGDLQQSVTTATKQVATLSEAHTALATKVGEVESVAQKSASVISNTVVGGAQASEEDVAQVASTPATKAEHDWDDTAFSRRAQR